MDTVKEWMHRNVTFGLVLAICTEVPRWVFAFMAAHEPVWAGVALAVLISYATAHAWEEYFARPERLLLALNGLSLFFGVYTIAPVLYVMSSARVHGAVALADVFPAWFIATWAFVLSCTTFLPLIQVAVVEVRRRERALPTVQASVHVQPAPPLDAPRGADDDDAPLPDGAPSAEDKPAYALWLKEHKGMTNIDIGRELGVGRNTVGRWLNGKG